MTLADALVYDAPGEAGEAHWNEEAKALIAGIILSIATSEPPATRTLGTLRDRLTLAPAIFPTMLEAMRHTHFLDSPRMTAVLGQSDFAFADVKASPATVYLAQSARSCDFGQVEERTLNA
ncbi:MAG: hypothetical protein BWY57_03273 [Betaproteobacteria bacterium ADurb.Bin341]|nr:MAG: hypothetical protein BWY57_03273 [Betaproteobacteria bacterium ADurb.Bin341]